MPALLTDTNPDVRSAMVRALQEQPNWPESFWQIVPELIDYRYVDAGLVSILQNQPNWPESVWQKVPELLTNTTSKVREAMTKALKNQHHWPQEVLDVLSKVGPDGKTLAEELGLTQALQDRRARPPLTPLKSFSCPLLFHKLGKAG